MKEGQQIRLSGQGQSGINGGGRSLYRDSI